MVKVRKSDLLDEIIEFEVELAEVPVSDGKGKNVVV
jgi:hypothetical protein